MSTDILRKPSVLVAAVAVLLLGGVVWGVTAYKQHKKNAVVKQIVASIQSESDIHKRFEKGHEISERKDLTQEQREEIWKNLRAEHEARDQKRMDEYFKSPPDQRVAILDRQINEMLPFFKEMEKRRAEREKAAATQPAGSGGGSGGFGMGGSGGPSGGGPGGNANAGGGRGWNGQGSSRERRKEWTESRSPEQHARRMAYRAAMSARAGQRGIQMPFGPGGR